ncbi:hypothetical protein LguiB_010036 [Lonicera macranthoides]
MYNRTVENAWFDKEGSRWHVVVKNKVTGCAEEYIGAYLVVATGENSQRFIPNFTGLEEFKGKNGVAYDLSSWDARTSIVVRSPVHVFAKEMVRFGMRLLKYLPCNSVDNTMVMLSKLKYGDLTGYGLERPTRGPFFLKKTTGRSPIIDAGTIDKIKDGGIQVLPSITMINEKSVEFANGKIKRFDAIIFATGYKSTVKKWLKDGGSLFNEDGMPKPGNPSQWKGENGLYCAGFSKNGLFGISNDA